jgi:hypothetical protein
MSTTDPLWRRFRYDVGLTLMKRHDGSYALPLEFPDADDLPNFERYYLGGHTYVVDDVEAAALLAAGYGDGLTALPVTTGYGSGAYGAGPYGS